MKTLTNILTFIVSKNCIFFWDCRFTKYESLALSNLTTQYSFKVVGPVLTVGKLVENFQEIKNSQITGLSREVLNEVSA